MSLYRRYLAYGLLGVIAAGAAWLWMLANEKHIERSITKRHSTDRWGM